MKHEEQVMVEERLREELGRKQNELAKVQGQLHDANMDCRQVGGEVEDGVDRKTDSSFSSFFFSFLFFLFLFFFSSFLLFFFSFPFFFSFFLFF